MKYAYSTKLSEHIHKDNIGQLICTDVPIARSGSQDYLENEIERNGSSKVVKLQRPWAVVKASAPTFEGKPFLESHPTVDVTIDNIKELSKGHIQNVRADDKNEILIADIIVKNKDTIELIETKKMREISCGYFYEIDDNNVVTEIRGEHVALVPEGRAGNTKIHDSDNVNEIFGGFLTEKKISDVKIGEWLHTVLRSTKSKEFVEVIKIVENKEKEQIALLLSNHIINPEFVVYEKDDVVEGLFGDIPKVKEKELTEKDHANYLTEKIGDENTVSEYVLKQVDGDSYYKSHIDGTKKIIAIFNVDGNNVKEHAKVFSDKNEALAVLEKLNANEKEYELIDLATNKAVDGIFDNIYIFMVKFFDGEKKYIGLTRDYDMKFIDEPEYAAQFDSKDIDDELSIKQRRQIENNLDIEQVVAVPLKRFYSGGE